MKLVRRPGYYALEGGPVPPGSAAITIGPVVSMRSEVVGHARLMDPAPSPAPRRYRPAAMHGTWRGDGTD